MSELALYRKYRGKTFAEILGQNHVVTTLTNALAHGRISHAYLLTGPRGVGKTSVARLLARAVNCLGTKSDLPCNACDICLIPLASNMDIIEIDAASNRRIDEIRDLRDKINLSPTRSRYKVYIIDEVHMLTTEAFNALLKTLEEPPAHAIFILATTESHKLPETIISRTQRFNFKAISSNDLTDHLSAIAAKENIIIEPAAVALIAEASHGSFRDAISLLDQVSGSSQEPVTTVNVSSLLGLSNFEAINQLVATMANHQPGEAISIVDSLVGQGIQISQLVNQLIQRWRQIMLSRLTNSKDPQPYELAEELSQSAIATIITRLSKVLLSPLPDVALEIALVELSLGHEAATSTPVAAPAQTAAPGAEIVRTASITAKSSPDIDSQASMQTLWPKVLMLIKTQNNSLYALLCSCKIDMSPDEIIISCRFSFHRDRIGETKNRAIIESALSKVYNKPIRVTSQVETGEVTEKSADPAGELVSSALEILGGEIIND